MTDLPTDDALNDDVLGRRLAAAPELAADLPVHQSTLDVPRSAR